jgi:hypothetical protein
MQPAYYNFSKHVSGDTLVAGLFPVINDITR